MGSVPVTCDAAGTAGTLIRREFGLEAAQLALGHSSAKVTDAVYAERDMARVIEVMKRIG
jgi:hypothetical protein